ncbi:pentatricopeptide repeat-containing protein At1g11290, chloroplastic-like [Cryptomeria japonica]|uniref:pentatricopeptide repeat-containing protein At1g11290, chloroplastic-like n=1 Tax=Cryptomeria japonica TaxID=3369 RepID=UPI0027D9F140|nr:pentatricopeptide repeat-containing protein At1g11290, chloroplastic-like [Cryptomeria japonica]
MYAKCGSLLKARILFDRMPQRDVASWNAVVPKWELWNREMQSVGVKATSATFASIVPACAKIGALEQGMEIHKKIIESEFPTEVAVSTLIDMYAKCGNTQKACKLFDRMHKKDVASWPGMIVGYSQNGIVI